MLFQVIQKIIKAIQRSIRISGVIAQGGHIAGQMIDTIGGKAVKLGDEEFSQGIVLLGGIWNTVIV